MAALLLSRHVDRYAAVATRCRTIAAALLVCSASAIGDETVDRWRSAIQRSDLVTLKQLVVSDVDVNAAGRYGKTALMLAAADGDLPLMRRLIARGADVNQRNRASGNALMYAAQYGQVAAAELLLAQGAEINHRGGKGWSALMIAVLKQRVPMVNFLLANGADPNTTDVLGWTPLMRATQSGNEAIVRLLLEHANTAVNAREHQGQTALHVAAIAGSVHIASLLMERGADPRVEDSMGNTPLEISRQRGHGRLATLLQDDE